METDADKARAELAAALWAAAREPAAGGAPVEPLAAAFGAKCASAKDSVAAVLNELESLESDMLRRQSEMAAGGADAERCAEMVGRIHGLCASARQNAVRAFGRAARHDAVNAIGAARNAVLLIADEATTGDRQRFVEIAQRNLQIAERLVRGQFADDGAADGPTSAARGSGRDERQNLRGSGERNHLDTRGL